MKTTLTILAAVMSLTFCSCDSKPAEKEKATKPAVDTMAVMVMQVQRCSKLYTTEYRVHKVLTHDDKLEMKGKLAGHDYNIPVPLGKRKVAIPIDATIKAYIDFASFSSDNVQRDSTHIRITLPPVRLLDQSFIDETRTRSFIESGKWSHKDREQMYRRADAMMRRRCLTPANIRNAQQNAKEQFRSMLQSMGYENVKVEIAN